MHLVSAADGATDAFDAAYRREHPKGSNAKELVAARAEAIRIDRGVRELQQCHPGYVRIDNEAGKFENKLTRAIDAVIEKLEEAPASPRR